MASPIPVLLDVDMGIEDALAIRLALRSPEIVVVGVTCVAGNVRLPLALRELEPEPADSSIVRLAHEHGRELAITAVGPWTNLALSCRRDPRHPSRLSRLVVMFGAATVSGNVTPAAEANAYNDPEAASEVWAALGTDGAAPSPADLARMTMVGLDATNLTLFPADIHVALGASVSGWADPVARTAHALLGPYVAADLASGRSGSPLHDPLAVCVLADLGIVGTRAARVEIETTGTYTRGATAANFSGHAERFDQLDDIDECAGMVPVAPNGHVAVRVDADCFVTRFHECLGLVSR